MVQEAAGYRGKGSRIEVINNKVSERGYNYPPFKVIVFKARGLALAPCLFQPFLISLMSLCGVQGEFYQ